MKDLNNHILKLFEQFVESRHNIIENPCHSTEIVKIQDKKAHQLYLL